MLGRGRASRSWRREESTVPIPPQEREQEDERAEAQDESNPSRPVEIIGERRDRAKRRTDILLENEGPVRQGVQRLGDGECWSCWSFARGAHGVVETRGAASGGAEERRHRGLTRKACYRQRRGVRR